MTQTKKAPRAKASRAKTSRPKASRQRSRRKASTGASNKPTRPRSSRSAPASKALSKTLSNPVPKDTKSATVLELLRRAEGATLAELMAVTHWQAHSVRGFLSGTVRKRLGLTLISEASLEGRCYRIAAGSPAAPPT